MTAAELGDRVAVIEAAFERHMNESISRSVAAGAKRVVLHSSSMAISMYERLGFTERCRLPVFATAALFGTHHH